MQKRTVDKLSEVLFNIADDLHTSDESKIILAVSYYLHYYWNRENERSDISAIYRNERFPIIPKKFLDPLAIR